MSEHKFTKLIHAELDKQTDQLTPDVLDDLKQVRQKALAEASHAAQSLDQGVTSWWTRRVQQIQFEPSTMMAGVSFASICLVAVLVFSLFPANNDAIQSQPALAMLDEELSEELEMLEQIEFVLWLAESEANTE